MSWNSLTLKDIMPGVFNKAQAALDFAQAGLDKLVDAQSVVAAKVAAAQAVVNALQTEIDELSATGFRIITLTPVMGSWVDRLMNAENSLENNNGMFSCGYINLAVSASESGAVAAYEAMNEALTTEFREPKMNPSLPEHGSFVSFPDISLPVDKWEGISLGELFPGVLKSIEDSLNIAETALKDIQNTNEQIIEKINLLTAAKNKASALINQLTTTGQYQLVMAPALGGWMTRAMSETGAPPTGGTYYTSGFAAIAISADLGEVWNMYNKLAAVM